MAAATASKLAKVCLALAAAGAVALALAVLAGGAWLRPEPLRVGFLGGLSGRVADLGAEGRNGALLAIEARNERGGVRGRRVELVSEDDEQDAEVGRRAVERLIATKVAAIVGPMTSAIATAVAPIANEAQLVMVSPTATTNALTGIDDHFFRVLAPTRSFARQSAEYHFGRLGARRVVPIADQRNKAYTDSWLADYQGSFTAAGGRVAPLIGFVSGEATDFGQLARTALANGPDAVLILANSVDAAMIAQHLRKLGSTVMITTSEWAATEQLIELGGRSVENAVIAQFLDRHSAAPAYVRFRDDYFARFGRLPGFAGLTGFDATNVVLDALDAQADGQSLKQALLARKTFAGAQGEIAFDAFGDASCASFMTIVRNGAFAVLP